MKIVVTGGAGFIGSHLVDALVKEGNQVVTIDNLSTGKKEQVNPKARFLKVDISSAPTLLRIFKQERPTCVFHLAAIPRVPLSVEDPITTSKVNILGTINVLKAAADTNVGRLIFASSSSVYGNQKEMPLKESMIPHPISPYALQKYTAEQFAKLFSVLYRLPVVSLRYFNVYGPRNDIDSDYSLVIGKFLQQHRKGKPLTIFGDGRQTRAFCYVDDVVDANTRAMKSKSVRGGDIINIGGTQSYSVNYLSRLIGGKVIHLPSRVGDIRHTQVDGKLAKKLLGWEPKTSFEEGMRKTKEWFLKTL